MPRKAEPNQSEIRASVINDVLRGTLPQLDAAIATLQPLYRGRKTLRRLRLIRHHLALLPLYAQGGMPSMWKNHAKSRANLRPRKARQQHA